MDSKLEESDSKLEESTFNSPPNNNDNDNCVPSCLSARHVILYLKRKRSARPNFAVLPPPKTSKTRLKTLGVRLKTLWVRFSTGWPRNVPVRRGEF